MKNDCIFTRLAALLAIIALLTTAGCSTTNPAPVEHGKTGTSASSSRSPDTYVVKSGDTLYSIARENNMDHRGLIALNNIENPNQISVGQTLRIKSGAAQAVDSSTTTAPISTDVVVVKPIDSTTTTSSPSSANTDSLKREPKAGKVPYSEQALLEAQGIGKPTEVTTPDKPEAKPETKPEQATGPDEVAYIWPAKGSTVGTYNEKGNMGLDIAGKEGDAIIAAAAGRVVYSGTGLRGMGKLVIIKHNNTYLSVYAHNKNILVNEGQQISKGQKIAEMGNTDADRVKLHFEIRKNGKPVDPMKYLPAK